MHDLAIIIVSNNDAGWLTSCLRTVFDHAGELSLDVVIADNGSDGAGQLVERDFPGARAISCPNRGFAHANNRALMTCDARYILFLNPDTEILEGTFEGLVDLLDRRPSVGLVGVRQLTSDGEVYPTIRRFPTALRTLAEAFASERLPARKSWLGGRGFGWLGERELRPAPYSRETPCDWTVGAFMLARREALESSGFMDERFFLYAEEPDLCFRMKQSGWEVLHLPQMEVVHHAGKSGVSARVEAQIALASLAYARKHFSRPHVAAFFSALLIRYGARSLLGRAHRGAASEHRAASRRALRTLLGLEDPPYREIPETAVTIREAND